VIRYIQNQEKHDARKSFKHEYLEMLKRLNVEYDEKYLLIHEERSILSLL